MSQQYSELFCQSNYSFLEGASHAEELVLQADFLRYKALAVTDECSVAGIVKIHSAIKQHKLSLKQIVGSMFWLNEECQVVFLCPNRTAYAELCRIITNARRRSSKGHYQLSEWDIMSAKHCFILWLPQQKNEDAHWGQWLSQHHSGRLWIGLQRHLKQTDQQYIDYCVELSQHHQLPITACGGVLMHNANRLPLQHSLTAIKYQKPITEVGSHLLANAERCLRSINKLSHIFKTEWLEESNRIAELCEFDLDSLRYEYPSELIPQGETPMSYLRMLVERGKQARFPQGVPSNIQQIIDKELGLIDDLDYPFFFLTIHDIVMFAKSQGILYQGRGSAANSVVCYCLEITSVDPRQISVLFERFISKERDEPPDIDVDFEHERREEVIQYIYQKYGRERAALAATVISYCSAWLKCYYPECFYASLLNSQPMGFYSPSQLVQDAQRHNVEVLPVCVNASQDNHIVVEHQNGLAIRLGLRQIKGFSEHGIQSVLANRPQSGYRHPSQVKQLSMNKKDIELLASANALHNVSGDRFQTRWAMMDSASDLPLFSQAYDDAEAGHDEHALHKPNEMQDLLEDFTSVGISLHKHPITLLEEAGRLGRFTHMKDLIQQRHKSMVTVVGLVTGKQSPGTAAGVTFVTLEDSTGNINVVVWGSTARAQQQAYLTAKALKVQGILEKEGEVVHVIAGKLIDITEEIVGLNTKSRDFH
ncbi:PHP domain-containing protein [Vibrio splendidus]